MSRQLLADPDRGVPKLTINELLGTPLNGGL